MASSVKQVATALRDGLRNVVSAVGTQKDKVASWRHDIERIDRAQIVAMYETDWLARKIVDIIPYDATREWRTWQHKRAEALYAAEKIFRFRYKIRRALTLGRLFGGAAILIGDGARDPERPLDVATIKQGGLKYLHVFNRHQLSTELFVEDLEDPDFGKPLFYKISASTPSTSGVRYQDQRIHRSRFIIFEGLEPADEMFTTDTGWGTPIYQVIRSAIINAGASASNAAALTEEAKVDVIQIPNLHALVSDDEGVQRVVERFTLANTLKSNINMLLLGGDETFDRKQISMAGFTDLMHAHLQIASGAADIPITRLLGQSPAGLNATGESDLRNYYDKIRGIQSNDLIETIDRVDEALIRHVMGNKPLSATYEWNPLWQPTDAERAATFNVKMDGVTKLNNLGLIAPEELRPALTDMLINDGTLSTLDQYLMPDEEAAALIEEQAQPPTEPGAGGDPPSDGPDAKPGASGGDGPNLQVISGGKKDAAEDVGDLERVAQEIFDAFDAGSQDLGTVQKAAFVDVTPSREDKDETVEEDVTSDTIKGESGIETEYDRDSSDVESKTEGQGDGEDGATREDDDGV